MAFITNLIRAVLLFVSFLSFIPQYRRLLSQRDSSGISLFYVLFNLISATEQFALGLFFVIEWRNVGDTIVHHPPNVGDWLNVSQFGIVWLCHFGLFILCLYYPPQRSWGKYTASAAYITFFVFSIGAIIFYLALLNHNSREDLRWLPALWGGGQVIFINPIVTIVGFMALFPQARALRSHPSPGALSVSGLFIQGIGFAVLAAYWPYRMRVSQEYWDISFERGLRAWLEFVGWATIDSAIYAIIQIILLGIAGRQSGVLPAVKSNPETVPLLYDQ